MKMWKEVKYNNPAVTIKEWTYTLPSGRVLLVQYNLHIGSPKEPNWYCSDQHRYLDYTNKSGYATLEEAKTALKKYVCDPPFQNDLPDSKELTRGERYFLQKESARWWEIHLNVPYNTFHPKV